MALPFQPPVSPMLARLESELPRGKGWLYEPKWDGFRAIVFREDGDVEVFSRDARPLGRYFPELLPALSQALPGACVVDGEIVIATAEGLDFDALLQRIHPAASRIQRLAAETPAAFVLFDILAEGSEDLRGAPLVERRGRLESLVPDSTFTDPRRPPSDVLLTPQTPDAEVASSWLEGLEVAGLDGVVAKQATLPYVAGERVMVKVKRLRTADCVVGGYRPSRSGRGVGSLLLGLYDRAGILHFVGHTSSFTARERHEVLERLRPFESGESFGRGRTPGGPSRWSAGRDPSYVSLEPRLVCEVAFDHLQGGRFRHGTRFLRWRPDLDPRGCTFDQLAPGRG